MEEAILVGEVITLIAVHKNLGDWDVKHVMPQWQ